MRKALALLFLFAFGCATTVWTKPGATGEQLADDRLACEQYSLLRCGVSSGEPGDQMGTAICRNRVRWNCMTERGWTEK